MLTGIIEEYINLLTSMNKPKGGRGIKAPYETTHLRVPVPIKPELERLIDLYKEQGNTSGDKLLTSFDEAVIAAKSILKQKKSARISLEKLLTAIYRQDISL